MWGVLSLSDKLQSPASQNSGQISFVLQFRHLTILLIFLLLTALPRWNSENYFSSEWKRDTWKISLSLRIFPGDSRQCPVCCKLTWGESPCSGGWDWGGGDLSIHIIISDTNTPVQLLFTFHQPSIRVIATTK